MEWDLYTAAGALLPAEWRQLPDCALRARRRDDAPGIRRRGGEARKKLIPALAPGNIDKVRTAPVMAMEDYDSAFYDRRRKLLRSF
ncbi:MAG: hypothetical protein V4724_29410 [Pseudomonadota bacterium]